MTAVIVSIEYTWSDDAGAYHPLTPSAGRTELYLAAGSVVTEYTVADVFG